MNIYIHTYIHTYIYMYISSNASAVQDNGTQTKLAATQFQIGSVSMQNSSSYACTPVALIVFRQYDAMIAPDEKKLLFDRHADVGEKEVLQQHLHHLVVAKFVFLHFKREGQSEGKVPRKI